MTIALFENPPKDIISTCVQFGHKIHVCTSYLDVFTRGPKHVIFCVDRQTDDEMKKIKTSERLTDFVHPKDAIYIFGKNTGENMSEKLKQFSSDLQYKMLKIDAGISQVFWTSPAIAIVLYDRWIKAHN